MLRAYVLSSWSIALELAPWLLLGMAVAGVLHVAVPRRFIQTHLTGRWAPAKAVLVGVPLPLCSCGVIPAGLGLKKDGASNGAALGFLISTPQTGVDSILVSASFLGWPFALFKVVTAAITGVLGGWLTDYVSPPKQASVDTGAASAMKVGGLLAQEPSPDGSALGRMFGHSLEVLRSIWKWLVFGVAVSAAIDIFLPPSWMASVAGLGGLGAALVTLLISLPLYVCATASVPIASALVASGLPAGAALVFLMAGPATNVATLGAILRGFGARVVAVYLFVLIVGSIGFGLLFDWILPISTATHAHSMDHTTWWAIASVGVLLAMIAKFSFDDLRHAWSSRMQATAPAREIAVSGLSCGSCAAKLETSLRQVTGVQSATVSVEEQTARVVGAAHESQLKEAVVSAGFGLR